MWQISRWTNRNLSFHSPIVRCDGNHLMHRHLEAPPSASAGPETAKVDLLTHVTWATPSLTMALFCLALACKPLDSALEERKRTSSTKVEVDRDNDKRLLSCLIFF